MADVSSPVMGPRLQHSLGVVEKQNEIKLKLKRTLTKLDEGTLFNR
jgi:hypothetical protein